ncbi:hypothetical protein EAI_10215 [Harpegnathos saltator]|uniref:Uncharacterized protein n=1 Tax=Harpegnathos saltator TaxID=610380 RepID=E2BKT0_HARSA|nr:hypothetical protein EAI_10215 [Harpegnathos saltator]
MSDSRNVSRRASANTPSHSSIESVLRTLGVAARRANGNGNGNDTTATILSTCLEGVRANRFRSSVFPKRVIKHVRALLDGRQTFAGTHNVSVSALKAGKESGHSINHPGGDALR